jgi:hypothetical protein
MASGTFHEPAFCATSPDGIMLLMKSQEVAMASLIMRVCLARHGNSSLRVERA